MSSAYDVRSADSVNGLGHLVSYTFAHQMSLDWTLCIVYVSVSSHLHGHYSNKVFGYSLNRVGVGYRSIVECSAGFRL